MFAFTSCALAFFYCKQGAIFKTAVKLSLRVSQFNSFHFSCQLPGKSRDEGEARRAQT